MTQKYRRFLIAFLTILAAFSTKNYAQLTTDETISVFLDCRGCSEQFIQSEIQFVNFVRDLADSDIHLLIIGQRTGSGGREFTLEYIGRKEFNDITEVLKVQSVDSDTEEERRNKLVSAIKLGFVSFLQEKSVFNRLQITFLNDNPTGNTTPPEDDPWNKWIFEIGGDSNFRGEESQSSLNLNGNLRARRITEAWKVELNYFHNYRTRSFTRTEEEISSTGDTTQVKVTESFDVDNQTFYGLTAKSLGDHWAIGLTYYANTSTQDNIDFRMSISPVIEYSVFPYSEFTRREITFRYELSPSYNDYTETSIFGQDEEFLLKQEFRFNSEFTKTWGSLEGGLNAQSFLHDFSKNRLRFDARLNMRIVRGVSVYVSGRYSLINDQLSLPAGDTSDEELLLNLRSQATSYNYGGSIGFEITFGSIFNNAINPRL